MCRHAKHIVLKGIHVTSLTGTPAVSIKTGLEIKEFGWLVPNLG